MPTETRQLTVSGVHVAVVRKAIKNPHLGVYLPDSRVRVAAPLAVSDAAVRAAVIGRLRWFKRQQAPLRNSLASPNARWSMARATTYLGRRYRLRTVAAEGAAGVTLHNGRVLEIHAPENVNGARRELLLQRWYWERLRELVPPLLDKWQTKC
jgi:predicted metal-dependent hydrolase